MGYHLGHCDSAQARFAATWLFVLVAGACGGRAETNADTAPPSSGSSAAGGRAGSSTGGGSTTHVPMGGTGGTGQPDPLLTPADLRFRSIEAGQTEYCGITRDDQRLVCVGGGEVTFEASGPFSAFDMDDQATGWDYRCAIRETGELYCFGETLIEPPAGTFDFVSVGAFSACAGTTCWIAPELGGVEPSAFGLIYSVNMWSFCTLLGSLHAECWGRSGEALLPPEAHYLAVVAAPSSGCAAVYANQPVEAPLEPPSTREEMLTRSGIACFSADAASWKVDGVFDWLDVNVNQDGCAVGTPAGETGRRLVCWGAFEGLATDVSADISDLSVSLTQICVLSDEGKVTCFDAAL